MEADAIELGLVDGHQEIQLQRHRIAELRRRVDGADPVIEVSVDEEGIGVGPLGDLGLLVVDNHLVTLDQRNQLHRAGIQAGLELGNDDRHDALAGRDPLQVLFLEVVRAQLGEDLRWSHR